MIQPSILILCSSNHWVSRLNNTSMVLLKCDTCSLCGVNSTFCVFRDTLGLMFRMMMIIIVFFRWAAVMTEAEHLHTRKPQYTSLFGHKKWSMTSMVWKCYIWATFCKTYILCICSSINGRWQHISTGTLTGNWSKSSLNRTATVNMQALCRSGFHEPVHPCSIIKNSYI